MNFFKDNSELFHNKTFQAQLVLVLLALVFMFSTSWFTTLAIFGCIGIVAVAVIASVWLLADLDVDNEQRRHVRQPLRLTLRGRQLVMLLVTMLVCVVALFVGLQGVKTDRTAQPIEHLYGFNQPTCWHPPMLADPALPVCP